MSQPTSRIPTKRILGILLILLAVICLVTCDATMTHRLAGQQNGTFIQGEDKSAHVNGADVSQDESGQECRLIVGDDEAIRVASNLSSGSVRIEFRDGSDYNDEYCPYVYASGTRSIVYPWKGECNITVTPSFTDSDGGDEPIEGTIDLHVIRWWKGTSLVPSGGRKPLVLDGVEDNTKPTFSIEFTSIAAALRHAGYPAGGLPSDLGGGSCYMASVDTGTPYPIVRAYYGKVTTTGSGARRREDVSTIWKMRGHGSYAIDEPDAHIRQAQYETPYGKTDVTIYEGDSDDKNHILVWAVTDRTGVEWQYHAELRRDDDGKEIVSVLM